VAGDISNPAWVLGQEQTWES